MRFSRLSKGMTAQQVILHMAHIVSYFAFVQGVFIFVSFGFSKKRKEKYVGIQSSRVINLSDVRLYILSGGTPYFLHYGFSSHRPGNPRLLWYFLLTLMFQLMWIKLFTLELFGEVCKQHVLFSWSHNLYPKTIASSPISISHKR